MTIAEGDVQAALMNLADLTEGVSAGVTKDVPAPRQTSANDHGDDALRSIPNDRITKRDHIGWGHDISFSHRTNRFGTRLGNIDARPKSKVAGIVTQCSAILAAAGTTKNRSGIRDHAGVHGLPRRHRGTYEPMLVRVRHQRSRPKRLGRITARIKAVIVDIKLRRQGELAQTSDANG